MKEMRRCNMIIRSKKHRHIAKKKYETSLTLENIISIISKMYATRVYTIYFEYSIAKVLSITFNS